MSSEIRICVLCNQDKHNKLFKFIRLSNAERTEKLREAYRRRHNGQELNQLLSNPFVHHRCYTEIVEDMDESIASSNTPETTEQNDIIHGEEQDQTSISSTALHTPSSSNVTKKVVGRRRPTCILCHRYHYSPDNKMCQIVSNYTANKLAEGFQNLYGRPYGKSLLDAYIHHACRNKLYKSYERSMRKALRNRNCLSYSSTIHAQNYSSPNGSKENESKLYYKSMATTDPAIELGALSDRFRPCIQQLTPEEIEFYTKRNGISDTSNNLITDQLPVVYSSIVHQPLTTNDANLHDHDYVNNVDEEDRSLYQPSSNSILDKQQKQYGTAQIRRGHLKPPPLSRPTNPLPFDQSCSTNLSLRKPSVDIIDLYDWLIEELNSSGMPISMGEVVKEYDKIIGGEMNTTTRESYKRERLKHRLEEFYPNQFVFVMPIRREGMFVALNNINHYVGLAMKHAKQEKERAIETSILPSSNPPAAPTSVDLQRQTCEQMMSAVRKIRLYIRDPEQTQCLPPLLIRNTIGLITASKRQFDKISHQYDFYRMIDEDLFANENNEISEKYDKQLRNISVASDLISIRHDNRISQKHYLLADELMKKNFHCTPRQVITLLNHYGHTCSYKSYVRMKASKQQAINEMGEELERMLSNEEIVTDSEIHLSDL